MEMVEEVYEEQEELEVAEPMDDQDIESIVKAAVDDAVDFIESEIAPDRIKAQKYFDGGVDIGSEEGRSTVVATKVRDVIRAIKPSLMRIFLSSDKYVEFVPNGPEDVQLSQQATSYIHYKFNQLGGYRILSDAFHDALIKKAGVVKVFWDTKDKDEIYKFNNLNPQEIALIQQDKDVQIVESETMIEASICPNTGMQIERPVVNLTVSKKKKVGDLSVISIPPEDFFISRDATSLEDCYVCGHRTDMRVADLVALGYDFDEVVELAGSDDSEQSDAEKFERTGYSDWDNDDNALDPSMRPVTVTEAYMRIDVNDTGEPMMYRVILAGANSKMLSYDICEGNPFAVFEVDPEAHTFFGRSVADLITDDQDAATAMIRGLLDNIALTNTPRVEVIDGQVNMDDVLNNEIGAVVRVKSAGAVREMAIPFVAGSTLPAIQYFDDQIEARTGVSRASMGLDPDALQNTTATAAQLTAQQGAAQVEVMARNLAEGGMRRMFKLMLKLMIQNVDEQVMMRLDGDSYTPVDPRSWNLDMDVSVNVGLGTGKEDQKAAALGQALQMQMQIWQAYGPQNGLVSMTQIRNTLADTMALAGIRNAERYFNPMTPQQEQQLIAAQQQNQGQQQVDQQAQAIIQAEQIKAQAKIQADNMKLQAQMQIKAQENETKLQKDYRDLQMKYQQLLADDDLKRDQMDQDLLVSAAEILGKYGTAVDVESIKAMQNAQRA